MIPDVTAEDDAIRASIHRFAAPELKPKVRALDDDGVTWKTYNQP